MNPFLARFEHRDREDALPHGWNWMIWLAFAAIVIALFGVEMPHAF